MQLDSGARNLSAPLDDPADGKPLCHNFGEAEWLCPYNYNIQGKDITQGRDIVSLIGTQSYGGTLCICFNELS